MLFYYLDVDSRDVYVSTALASSVMEAIEYVCNVYNKDLNPDYCWYTKYSFASAGITPVELPDNRGFCEVYR